ncbi:MAG: BMC domain-containing protein [Candidatus Latescibacterota bacterium]
MQAIGFIETKGFVAAVEAADSALKAANVAFVGQKRVGSGLVAVILTGDVAAVKAAIEAGTESAAAVGQVVAAQVIASPHEDMAGLLFEEPAKQEAKPAPKAPEESNSRKKNPGV